MPEHLPDRRADLQVVHAAGREVGQTVVARLDGEDDQQEQAEPEAGHGDADEGERGHQMVDDGVLPDRAVDRGSAAGMHAVQKPDGRGDLFSRTVALHGHGTNPNFQSQPATQQDLQHVAHRRSGGTRDHGHPPGKSR